MLYVNRLAASRSSTSSGPGVRILSPPPRHQHTPLDNTPTPTTPPANNPWNEPHAIDLLCS